MSHETWEIIKKIEVEKIELELAVQCAPLIAGLKISNLLNINKDDLLLLDKTLENSNLSWRLLYSNEYKANILLYNSKLLEEYLNRDEVRSYMEKLGYNNLNLEIIFSKFCDRYENYMNYKKNFPHELGFLLGYPVEDIAGFIENNGENYLYVGYWKVYQDCEKKIKIFNSFENAKESLIKLLYYGISMTEIISICCNNNRKIQINY